jgi:hypothetical protein
MKKRAALCIRGAVSKKTSRYTYKDSLYTNDNEYVKYTSVYKSIKHHIIDANPEYDVDIFIHSWSTDLEENLIDLYRPKSSLFEDNRIYSSEIESKCCNSADYGGISHSLSIKKVLELKEQAEISDSFEYDIVILFRPDVLIWTDMILLSYDLSYFYTDGHTDNNGDIHFVMSSNDSKQFKQLYNSLDYGNKHVQHSWIKNYLIKYCNFNIRGDRITPGLHEEVLRHIYQTSIKNGHITEAVLNSYDITFDDIELYSLY